MEGRRRQYLNPLELFLFANFIFFVVGGVTNNTMMTTHLNSHLCCQWHSVIATRKVNARIAELKRGSWSDATRDSASDTPRAEMKNPPPVTPAQLRADSVRYRLILTGALARFQSRFDMTSEQSARSLVIIMVPLLALFVALFSFGRGTGVQHLVFALHFYSFALLLYTVTWILFIGVLQPLHVVPGDAVWGVFVLGLQTIYMIRSLARVYGGSLAAYVAKGLVLGVLAYVILNVYRFLLFLVAFHAS
jgi:hypothetical protein